MATNERRALMRHMGLKLVEHAAVELRPVLDSGWGTIRSKKVAILKDFTGVAHVWLGGPADLDAYAPVRASDGSFHSAYLNYLSRGAADLYGYADWPLRIEGLFAVANGDYLKYEVDEYGNQWFWRLSRASARKHELSIGERASIDLRHLRPITMREVEPRHRPEFMWAYANMLEHQSGSDGAAQLRNRMSDAGFNHHFGTYNVYEPRHVRWYRASRGLDPVPVHRYLPLRQALKEMGTLIGRPGTDVQTFMEAYRNFVSESDFVAYFTGPIHEAWNRVHPGSGVVECTCGHLEAAPAVTAGARGMTICHRCIEEGRYHFLEDLQMYGDHGYEHEDGLYYSYPSLSEDEEDGDDYEDPPGVRGYSTDVRSFLKSDTNIISSSYGDFLMGIELEVVPKYERHETAEHTLKTLAPGYAILKSDGSLSSGGFEIVTAPRGLKEHITRFSEWQPHPDLRAWDAKCCGTHVHISSQAFSAATLGKFIELINLEKNDNFIRSIAGRHPRWDSQAENYCQRDGCTPGNPKKTLQDKNPDRYFMVNTTNVTPAEAMRLGLDTKHAVGRSQNTIEIRVFRASLKKARLLAQIEFAHASVMFCRWSSMRELDQDHFVKWLKGMAGIYPNLAKWFGVRANTEVVEATPKARAGADV